MYNLLKRHFTFARIWQYFLLSILLVYALRQRYIGLVSESFWLDEAYTLAFTNMPFGKMLDYIATRDVHPPLSYIFIKFMRLFGDSDFLLKSTSTVFDLATIAIVWAMVKKHWGALPAFVSAIIIATSSCHIWHSQDIRMYAMLSLLASCSLYLFLDFMTLVLDHPKDTKASALLCAATAVVNIMMLFTHNLAALFWAGQLMIGMTTGILLARNTDSRKHFIAWIKVQIAIGILYAPWIIFTIKQSSAMVKQFWLAAPALGDTLPVISYAMAFQRHYNGSADALMITMLCIFTLSAIAGARTPKPLILLLLSLIPIAAAFLYSIYRSPVLHGRMLSFISIPLTICASQLFTLFKKNDSLTRKTIHIVQIIAGLFLVHALIERNITQVRIERKTMSKTDYRGAADQALIHYTNNTVFVFSNPVAQIAFDHYFDKLIKNNAKRIALPCHYTEVPAGNSSLEMKVTPESVEKMIKDVASYERIIFIGGNGNYTDPRKTAWSALDANLEMITDASKNGVPIIVYRHKQTISKHM